MSRKKIKSFYLITKYGSNIIMDKISIRKAPTAIPGLIDLINHVEANSEKPFKDFVLVEVGSFVGDSTRVFARRCKEIHSVDPWKNGYDDEHDPSSYTWPMERIEAQFDEVVEECGNIIKHKMTSLEGAELFEDESIDMVYIDGNHLYEYVKQDIIAWSPKVKKGGWVCGHDWQHKKAQGVKPAVLETVGQPDKTFQDTSWCKHWS
jgi:hypothetical protein